MSSLLLTWISYWTNSQVPVIWYLMTPMSHHSSDENISLMAKWYQGRFIMYCLILWASQQNLAQDFYSQKKPHLTIIYASYVCLFWVFCWINYVNRGLDCIPRTTYVAVFNKFNESIDLHIYECVKCYLYAFHANLLGQTVLHESIKLNSDVTVQVIDAPKAYI